MSLPCCFVAAGVQRTLDEVSGRCRSSIAAIHSAGVVVANLTPRSFQLYSCTTDDKPFKTPREQAPALVLSLSAIVTSS